MMSLIDDGGGAEMQKAADLADISVLFFGLIFNYTRTRQCYLLL